MWITDPRRHCRLPAPRIRPGTSLERPLWQSLTLPFINFSYLLFYKRKDIKDTVNLEEIFNKKFIEYIPVTTNPEK